MGYSRDGIDNRFVGFGAVSPHWGLSQRGGIVSEFQVYLIMLGMRRVWRRMGWHTSWCQLGRETAVPERRIEGELTEK